MKRIILNEGIYNILFENVSDDRKEFFKSFGVFKEALLKKFKEWGVNNLLDLRNKIKNIEGHKESYMTYADNIPYYRLSISRIVIGGTIDINEHYRTLVFTNSLYVNDIGDDVVGGYIKDQKSVAFGLNKFIEEVGFDLSTFFEILLHEYRHYYQSGSRSGFDNDAYRTMVSDIMTNGEFDFKKYVNIQSEYDAHIHQVYELVLQRFFSKKTDKILRLNWDNSDADYELNDVIKDTIERDDRVKLYDEKKKRGFIRTIFKFKTLFLPTIKYNYKIYLSVKKLIEKEEYEYAKELINKVETRPDVSQNMLESLGYAIKFNKLKINK